MRSEFQGKRRKGANREPGNHANDRRDIERARLNEMDVSEYYLCMQPFRTFQ